MKTTAGGETLESMSQAVWYNQWTLRKFAAYLRGDILEVGCGIGNFTKFLTKYGKVWAIDIEEKYIDQTKEVIGNDSKIGFGDIEEGKYFFGDKKFDCVICINVLEHIKNDDKALKNLSSLLKSNGYLILLVPLHMFLYTSIDKSLGHFRRYNKNNLIRMMKIAGLDILKSIRLNFLGAIGWFITGKILGSTKIDESKIQIFNLISPPFLNIENILEPPLGTSILLICKKNK